MEELLNTIKILKLRMYLKNRTLYNTLLLNLLLRLVSLHSWQQLRTSGSICSPAFCFVCKQPYKVFAAICFCTQSWAWLVLVYDSEHTYSSTGLARRAWVDRSGVVVQVSQVWGLDSPGLSRQHRCIWCAQLTWTALLKCWKGPLEEEANVCFHKTRGPVSSVVIERRGNGITLSDVCISLLLNGRNSIILLSLVDVVFGAHWNTAEGAILDPFQGKAG